MLLPMSTCIRASTLMSACEALTEAAHVTEVKQRFEKVKCSATHVAEGELNEMDSVVNNKILTTARQPFVTGTKIMDST